MNQIQKAKYLFVAAFDIILLNIHRIEQLDEWVKRGSLYIGLIVCVLTAVKFSLDIWNRMQVTKMNNIRIRRQQEELRRFFEQKHKA
jgi:hypothetical protein